MAEESNSTGSLQHAERRLHLLYHELRPEASDYSYVVETAKFERHLDLFFQLRNANADLLPEVTFDDGHMSNYTQALPALHATGMKARFFITVGWTETKAGYMGWEHLKALHDAGQQIGAHGWSHTLLTHCSGDQLRNELSRPRLTLEDKLGTSIQTMSLPGGRFNQRVIAACRESGYTQIFTSIPRAEADSNALMVGRLNIRGDMDTAWIERLFEPGGQLLSGLKRQHQIKATAKALMGDRLYEWLWSRLNRQEPEMDAGETKTNEHTAHHQ